MHTGASEETPVSAREHMEDLVTAMVNRWLQLKMAEHDYDPAMVPLEANKFFNLPLRTVYHLLLQDFLIVPSEEQPPFLKKETVIEYLKEAARPALPDDIMDKTSIRQWIQQQDHVEPLMSLRLHSVLSSNEGSFECVEYIDKRSFLKCRGSGETTWQEFVQRRGY